MSTLTIEQSFEWLAFRADWKDWKPLKAVIELTASRSSGVCSYEVPPVPTLAEENKTEVPEEVTSPTITQTDANFEIVKNAMSARSRKYQRYEARFHIEVICDQRHFSSFSTNISVGGIALEDPIPSWVAGYCTVVISTLDLKKRLEFLSSVVEDQAGEKYRLELHASPMTSELRRWLEEADAEALDVERVG